MKDSCGPEGVALRHDPDGQALALGREWAAQDAQLVGSSPGLDERGLTARSPGAELRQGALHVGDVGPQPLFAGVEIGQGPNEVVLPRVFQLGVAGVVLDLHHQCEGKQPDQHGDVERGDEHVGH